VERSTLKPEQQNKQLQKNTGKHIKRSKGAQVMTNESISTDRPWKLRITTGKLQGNNICMNYITT
jgi:hypothetical protein